MVSGAARILKQHESEIRGTVKLVFQPSEEGSAGGRRIREERVLESPHVDRIFELHVWPSLTGSGGCRSPIHLQEQPMGEQLR